MGRPLLVTEDEDGVLKALTGSHRLAAALHENLRSVPIYTIKADDFDDALAGIIGPKVLTPKMLTRTVEALGDLDAMDILYEEEWL